MTFQLSQRFYFDAAHTLQRALDTESSRRIHSALTGELYIVAFN